VSLESYVAGVSRWRGTIMAGTRPVSWMLLLAASACANGSPALVLRLAGGGAGASLLSVFEGATHASLQHARAPLGSAAANPAAGVANVLCLQEVGYLRLRGGKGGGKADKKEKTKNKRGGER